MALGATLCIKLAPVSSAAAPPTEHAIANRVAEAVLCARWYPHLQFFLDTFQEIDRGYYIRSGLVDRRCNPSLAGNIFRQLHVVLAQIEPVSAPSETAKGDWSGLAFQGRTGAGILWLPGNEQPPDASRGSARPVCEPAGAHRPIIGPWIEFTRAQ
jgi:hypothetical protein